jgi:hypothetical protein
MKKLSITLFWIFAMLVEIGSATVPTKDLEPQVAIKLVALKANVPQNAIEISFIIDGTLCGEKGFEASHARRVAAIHAVRKEGGGQSRVMVFYDFIWNESLGWFMWESQPERTGVAVYIWSENKGSIVNR